MPKLGVQVHPSIRPDHVPQTIEGDFQGITIIEAVRILITNYVDLVDLITLNDKVKPGLLVFADKIELTSMNLLDEKLDQDMHLRIVPVLHGG